MDIIKFCEYVKGNMVMPRMKYQLRYLMNQCLELKTNGIVQEHILFYQH